jgi:arylsulfatase A-like enzyme
MFGEGGVRIPLIVSWPGRLPQSEMQSRVVSAMDVFPTVVTLAGGHPAPDLDGRVLLPNLVGTPMDAVHDHLCFADGKGTWSIRQGDWKLISSPGWNHLSYRLDAKNIAHRSDDVVYPAGLVLFNLKEDIGETTDLAPRYPERVQAMKTLYETWRAKMGKPVSGKVKSPK